MKSLEDRYDELKSDPKKLAKFFKITWIVAYSTLMLGIVLIVWILLNQKTF